jgi:SPP1 gp7 family putative phage head morphogenesis protein
LIYHHYQEKRVPVFSPELNNNGRKKDRKGRAIRPDKKLETRYRQQLFRVNRTLQDEYLRLGRLIRDGQINQADALRRLDLIEEQLAQRGIAQGIAERVVGQADGTNRERMENMFKNMFGVDVFGIIDERGLTEQLAGMTQENVGLITSVPKQSIQQARTAINANFRGEDLKGGTLVQELRRLGVKDDNRAKLIARDQTSKLNSAINQARQQSVGIEEYIWRTSKDERVVGNPAGLYPDGNRKHNKHWQREGKKFKWSSPPPDGHPGQPINCR